MEFLKKIKEKFLNSLNDHAGKPSSSRISSYVILLQIQIIGFSFLVIDLINSIKAFQSDRVYEIPFTHVGIFSLILAHHLFLLGLKKSGEKSLNNGIFENIKTKISGVDSSKKPEVDVMPKYEKTSEETPMPEDEENKQYK